MGIPATKDHSKKLHRRPFSNAGKRHTEESVIHVGSIDYTSFLVIFLLVLIGVIMVFSAGSYNARVEYNDAFFFLKRQGIFAVMGICIMIFMANFNYKYLMKFVVPMYFITNALLIAVRFVGREKKGAQRWIDLPIIGQFQPSELAKISVLLLVAYLIYKRKDILKKWPGFLFVTGIVGITVALVILGSLSSAIIVAIIGFGVVFIASPHILRFVVAGGMGITAVYVFITFFSKFRSNRVNAWLDPFAYLLDGGYQIVQSLYAVASGGAFGLGIGQSRQASFLPDAHNDFIFAIICEELGFVGAALVLTLFGILIWRLIHIAINASDVFGALIASGIALMIASQVIINVAVVTNTIPNTGITMPFISYGGTSLLVNMFLMGVALNISRYSKQK